MDIRRIAAIVVFLTITAGACASGPDEPSESDAADDILSSETIDRSRVDAESPAASDDSSQELRTLKHTVDHTELLEALEDPPDRLVPNIEDGHLDGVSVIRGIPDEGMNLVELRTGDVLHAIDDTPVDYDASVEQIVDAAKAGEFSLLIERDGEEHLLQITVE